MKGIVSGRVVAEDDDKMLMMEVGGRDVFEKGHGPEIVMCDRIDKLSVTIYE